MTSKIVIYIPMELSSRQAVASALLDKYGTDYLFLGRTFQETSSNESCQIDIYDPARLSSGDRFYYLDYEDLYLVRAIEFKARDENSDPTLTKIGYQQVVCLISNDLGYATCLKIARFARVFLNIGGIAVTVKSAGITHQADKWLANYNSIDIFDIYSLFVGLVEGENSYYSCGMHNFGKADVSVEIAEDLGLAIYVMNVFNYYRLTDSPILQEGHTFQPDIESPRYKMQWLEDDEHETEDPLFNPYGRWYLERC